MVYDPVRQRVLLFGGNVFRTTGNTLSNELWEWNGTAWTPTTYVAGTVNVSAPISGNGAGSALGLSYGSGLTVSGGALVPDFGTTSGKTAQGNDSRFPPAPSSAGRVLYDSGTAWTALAAGTSGQLLRGGSTPAWTTALTNGQILIGSTGSSPVAASLTNGGGITATGGAGTITLGSSAGGDIAGTVASATVGGLQGQLPVDHALRAPDQVRALQDGRGGEEGLDDVAGGLGIAGQPAVLEAPARSHAAGVGAAVAHVLGVAQPVDGALQMGAMLALGLTRRAGQVAQHQAEVTGTPGFVAQGEIDEGAGIHAFVCLVQALSARPLGSGTWLTT